MLQEDRPALNTEWRIPPLCKHVAVPRRVFSIANTPLPSHSHLSIHARECLSSLTTLCCWLRRIQDMLSSPIVTSLQLVCRDAEDPLHIFL